MLHSPVTTLVGTACSLHQKILKCSWDILPKKERDLVAPIKEGYSNGKQKKLPKKGHVKAIRKNDPQIRHGKPLTWTTPSDTHFQFRVLNISPHMRNHNSANHKSGQFQQSHLHTPDGSAKSQASANSVRFACSTGKSMQVPLPFDVQTLITASF